MPVLHHQLSDLYREGRRGRAADRSSNYGRDSHVDDDHIRGILDLTKKEIEAGPLSDDAEREVDEESSEELEIVQSVLWQRRARESGGGITGNAFQRARERSFIPGQEIRIVDRSEPHVIDLLDQLEP